MLIQLKNLFATYSYLFAIHVLQPFFLFCYDFLCFCFSEPVAQKIATPICAIFRGAHFKKIDLNDDEGYLEERFSLLDIALTVSGYHKINTNDLKDPNERITSLILPLKTQKILEMMIDSEVFHFDFDEVCPYDQDTLPESSLLHGNSRTASLRPIKLIFSVSNNSMNFSDLLAKEKQIKNFAWFCGQKTKHTEFFFRQPKLLANLFFDREVALAMAAYFNKNWPNFEIEKSEFLSYPIDKNEFERINKRRTESKFIMTQKNVPLSDIKISNEFNFIDIRQNQTTNTTAQHELNFFEMQQNQTTNTTAKQKFVDDLFDLDKETCFPVAKYITVAYFKAMLSPDEKPYAQMLEFIHCALTLWKNDLIKNGQLEDVVKTLSIKNNIVSAIWISSLPLISGKLTPTKQDRASWGIPSDVTRETILQHQLDEVFHLNNKQ